ncbi:hypothetical protein POM88_001705 [Heracleum sosnowskyi]|uniref:Uncharacterized protein n=1 Tax=Heracleum sosnowskyi TaxID=360622 RepID=A0AAD8JGN7_9APIA|nr:hypothetical protein POM88_001705 [Heracleum sosnowskyi]
MVTYWILFSLICLFEHTFSGLLQWLPVWPYAKILAIFWLVIPRFDGAIIAYDSLVSPCLSLQLLQVVLDLLNKNQNLSLEGESFLVVAQRYVDEHGTEALEKLISLKPKNIEPTFSEADIKEVESLNQSSAPAENKGVHAGEELDSASTGHKVVLAAWLTLERNPIEISDQQVSQFRQLAIHELLPRMNPGILVELGPCPLITSYCNETYTPAEGFLLKCVSDYYSVLPFIGHSIKAIDVLHAINRKYSGKDVNDDPALDQAYRLVEVNGFFFVALTLSYFIIPPKCAASKIMSDVYTKIDYVRLIDELVVGDVDVKRCFSVIGHMVELDQMGIKMPNIPGFLGFSELIVCFVNSVAKGKSPKEHLKIKFEEQYSGQPCNDTLDLTAEIAEETAALKSGNASQGGRAGKQMVIHGLEVDQSKSLAANLGEHLYVDPSGHRGGKSGDRGREDAQKRKRTETDYVTKQDVKEVKRIMDSNHTLMMEKISIVNKKLDQMNNTLGQADLSKPEDRARIKEQSMKIASEVKSLVVKKDFKGVADMSDVKKDAINLLKKAHLRPAEANLVIAKIKEVVRSTSSEHILTYLTVDKLRVIGYRERLIETLRQCDEEKLESSPIDDSERVGEN